MDNLVFHYNHGKRWFLLKIVFEIIIQDFHTGSRHALYYLVVVDCKLLISTNRKKTELESLKDLVP